LYISRTIASFDTFRYLPLNYRKSARKRTSFGKRRPNITLYIVLSFFEFRVSSDMVRCSTDSLSRTPFRLEFLDLPRALLCSSRSVGNAVQPRLYQYFLPTNGLILVPLFPPLSPPSRTRPFYRSSPIHIPLCPRVVMPLSTR